MALFNPADAHLWLKVGFGLGLMGVSAPGRLLGRYVGPIAFFAGVELIAWGAIRSGAFPYAFASILALTLLIAGLERRSARRHVARPPAPEFSDRAPLPALRSVRSEAQVNLEAAARYVEALNALPSATSLPYEAGFRFKTALWLSLSPQLAAEPALFEIVAVAYRQAERANREVGWRETHAHGVIGVDRDVDDLPAVRTAFQEAVKALDACLAATPASSPQAGANRQAQSFDDFLIAEYGSREVAGVLPGVAAARRKQVNHDNAVYVRDQFESAARRMRQAARHGKRDEGWPLAMSWNDVKTGLSSQQGIDRAYSLASRASEVVDWANALDDEHPARIRLWWRSRHVRAAATALTVFLEQ